jgi:sugar transferase EpsL
VPRAGVGGASVSGRRRARPEEGNLDVIAKRVADTAAAALLLVLLSPLLLLTAAVVRLGLGAPVLFRQERVGLGGRVFVLLKFRTMADAHSLDGQLQDDAARLTPLGRWLRRLSLDELPQLWNVIRGDMALVGPRPLVTWYLPRYSRAQRRRHEVRPGITGWAQVHGRNRLSWERKFELDVWYVDHASPWLDCRILLMTVAKVLRREGISQEGQTSSEEFMGDPGPTSMSE